MHIIENKLESKTGLRQIDWICFLMLAGLAGLQFLLPPGWQRQAVAGAFTGGLLGYATNWLVIRMLFWPYSAYYLPRWLGARKIPLTPGLLVTKQAGIAASIGRTISSTLLSPQAIRSYCERPEVRDRLRERVAEYLEQLASDTYPAPARCLPAESMPDILGLRDRLLGEADSAFRRMIADRLTWEGLTDRLIAYLQPYARTPLSRWIKVEQRERLATAICDRLQALGRDGNGSSALEETIGQAVAEQARRLVDPDGRDLLLAIAEQRLPPLVDQGVDALAERLKNGPDAERMQVRLAQALIEAVLGSQGLFGPIMPLLEGLGRGLLSEILNDGVRRYWEPLVDACVRTPALRAQVLDTVTGAIRNAQPDTLAAGLNPEHIQAGRRLATQFLRGVIEQVTRNTDVHDAIYAEISRLCRSSLADFFPDWQTVLRRQLPEIIRNRASDVAAELSALVHTETARMLDRYLFEIPIGNPAERFGRERTKTICRTGAGLVVDAVAARMDQIVEPGSVGRIAESSMLGFDAREIEKTVRDVADAEMKMIIVFGGYLGMIVGAVLRLVLY